MMLGTSSQINKKRLEHAEPSSRLLEKDLSAYDSRQSLAKIPSVQSADNSFEERNKRMAEFRQQRDEPTPLRAPTCGSRVAPYEITAIRAEYVVLNNEERFIAKSAVRMIIRNLPTESAEANNSN